MFEKLGLLVEEPHLDYRAVSREDKRGGTRNYFQHVYYLHLCFFFVPPFFFFRS